MDRQEATRHRIHDLLRRQRLGVLSTSGEAGPYASLVAFAVTDDLAGILFATTRSTRKFANLSTNPSAAFLVDDRANDTRDFRRALAVTATGTAAELHGDDRAAMRTRYLAKHPYLKEFVDAPTCALVRLTVGVYYAVRRFQNVMELHLIK